MVSDHQQANRTTSLWRVNLRVGASILGLGLLAGLAGCGGSESQAEMEAAAQGDEVKEPRFIPVPLGEYGIHEVRPAENVKLEINFSIQIVINEEKKSAFEKIYGENEHTIRDQVIVAVRTAETFEFDEPRLDWLRKRIHLRIEPFFSEVPIKEIYLTDFVCQIE